MAEKFKKHYNIDLISNKDANINIIYGERSNGKSYQLKHKKAVLHYFESGKRFILLRRYKEEITSERVENYFNDVDIEKISHGKYNCFVAWQRKIFLGHFDTETMKVTKGEYIGYYCALSQEQIFAGSSWLDVDTIIFEEFMSRTHYLVNESTKLMNFYSTVDRKRGTTKMWLVGNTISRICPYLKDWNLLDIVKTQKQGTIEVRYIKVDDETSVKLAVEYCENTGQTSYIFGEHADMLNKGEWQSDRQPHLSKSLKKYDICYRMVFDFKGFKFLASYLFDRETHEYSWFICPKSSIIKNNTLVICDYLKEDIFYQRDIYNIPFKRLKNVLESFRETNIYYSTDLCGTDFKQAIDFTIRK